MLTAFVCTLYNESQLSPIYIHCTDTNIQRHRRKSYWFGTT